MGADVIINSKEKNLKEEILKLTDANGVSRLVEASGATPMVNSSFSFLRKVRLLLFKAMVKGFVYLYILSKMY